MAATATTQRSGATGRTRASELAEESTALIQRKAVAAVGHEFSQMRVQAEEEAAPAPKTKAAIKADLKKRMSVVVTQYLALWTAYQREVAMHDIPGVSAEGGGQLHEALAWLFIQYNPGARIHSMNADAVGVDVSDIAEWNEKESGEDVSKGTWTATRDENAAFFPAGPGTVWFTRAGVKANLGAYRKFVHDYHGDHLPTSLLAKLMDPYLARKAGDLGAWVTDRDYCRPREAPLLIQFVADLNPLMAVAKIVNLVVNNEALYTGKQATTWDWIEGSLGLAGLAESIFGDLVKLTTKGSRTQKVLATAHGVASGLADPLRIEAYAETIVGALVADKEVHELVHALITAAVEEGLSTGAESTVKEVLPVIGEPAGKAPSKEGGR